MQNMKEYLDNLVQKYETKDFIKNDPIQFPHRFYKKQDIEISALIASSFAFGRREKIIEVVEKIHNLMQNEPYNFCLNYKKSDEKIFENMEYRYVTNAHILGFFQGLAEVLRYYNSLEDIFLENYSLEDFNIKNGLTGFVDRILPLNSLENNYLLPSPNKKSACKRLNLFLKWMIRKGPVDLGLWKNISLSQLLIPIDVHVARISRKLGLFEGKSNNWQTAEIITEKLKEFEPNDPVKYDFALFGYGIEESKMA